MIKENNKGNDFVINLIVIAITILITYLSSSVCKYMYSKKTRNTIKEEPVFNKYDIEGFLEGL